MIRRLLIANRGEIACRITTTARTAGIRVIAVYSTADRHARHVELADEAHCIGPPAARDSYLNQTAILATARAARADAVHPGYGFLAENSAFAAAVADAGMIFVGPRPATIEAMGNKARAKRIMAAAGVPVVPGYEGEAQDNAALERAAAEVGFPLLIKAAAGGGGKGMRVVRAAGELPAALTAARRESHAAFASDALILERYLTHPRHIEVQIFGDQHGNLVTLAERDCSIQRRYQKVVEEAPAAGITNQTRRELSAAARRAAAAVDYLGAGTVEFLVQDGAFYFMEMNTRLQVEHPVTEMILGLDLVDWQLRVAAGEALPRAQADITPSGHAVEARLYAEDPGSGFLPATGVIRHLELPQAPGVRVDTGVREGDEITSHYDPLIAKLVAWGADRAAALEILHDALMRAEIVGLKTNLALLVALTRHPAIAAGAADTSFMERHPEVLAGRGLGPPGVIMAALASVLEQLGTAGQTAREAGDEHSPWLAADGFRANQVAIWQLELCAEDGTRWPLTLCGDARATVLVALEERRWVVKASLAGRHLSGTLDGEPFTATALVDAGTITIVCRGVTEEFVVPGARVAAGELASGSLTSPMPGQVIDVKVAVGDRVQAGDTLLIVEAMKMEHAVRAPAPGRISEIRCAVGDRVKEGVILAYLEADHE